MRISDWSSDVCSSDLLHPRLPRFDGARLVDQLVAADEGVLPVEAQPPPLAFGQGPADIDVPTVGLDRAEVVEDVVEADDLAAVAAVVGGARSEERRVGKECVSTCRSRWSTSH